MTTKKQAADIKVPDGYELKNKGRFRSGDLVFKDGDWTRLGNKKGSKFFGESIEKSKVHVARKFVKITE